MIDNVENLSETVYPLRFNKRRFSEDSPGYREVIKTLEDLPGAAHYLTDEICRGFGRPTYTSLIRSGVDSCSVGVNFDSIKHTFCWDSRGNLSTKGKLNEFPSTYSMVTSRSDIPINEAPMQFLSDFLDSLYYSLSVPLQRRTFYLPADRAGFMLNQYLVYDTLLTRESMARRKRRAAELSPSMTGVASDFLRDLQVLKGDIGTLADSIAGLLPGDLIRRRSHRTEPSRFFFKFSEKERPLPLIHVSSMVLELAPVIIHLRYLVKEGDVMIVEEPESHLHPAMQVRFARELVHIVNRGVRVIITTHSPLFLDVIANQVGLSGIDRERRPKVAGRGQSISRGNVGAWLFDPEDDGGSVVREILLDSDTGTYPAQFDEVSERLYGDWVRIARKLNK